MGENDREYGVVLWGATGFTGRLVAEHLADRYDASDLDWAIAGRSRERLAALRDDLADVDPAWGSLDLLVGDAFDRESLDAIAERTAVVCSTVGPFAEYGTDLVEACVENGTDYCDLAGELHWIQQTVDDHHDEARERGVRIVHACGFDSVPSDCGTLMLQNYARETHGTACSAVRTYVSSRSFALTQLSNAGSGGTMASLSGTYAARSRDPDARRAIDEPYSLAPAGERSGPDDASQRWPAGDDDGEWTAPFLMAPINEKVVRRSNAVLGYPWGRAFEYGEVTPAGSGLSGAVTAAGVSVGLAAFAVVMSVAPLRNLADRFVLPDSGEGPSREWIEDTSFEVRLVGTGTTDSGREFSVHGTVAGDRDPGYGAAALMVAEAAICLANGDTDTPVDGGVLTPATGIGMPLVDRLREAGITFAVGPDASPGT